MWHARSSNFPIKSLSLAIASWSGTFIFALFIVRSVIFSTLSLVRPWFRLRAITILSSQTCYRTLEPGKLLSVHGRFCGLQSYLKGTTYMCYCRL